MGDSSGVDCFSKFDWAILGQIECAMGSSACCVDQSRVNTLLVYGIQTRENKAEAGCVVQLAVCLACTEPWV